MKNLRFLNFWLLLGWIQVGIVILLSLIPVPVEVPHFNGMDKLIHLFTYTFVMMWFGLCYNPGRIYIKLGMGLILMGIVLELIQRSIGYRSMSYLDMTANSLGVIIGWFLAGTPLSGALVFLEHRLLSKD